MVSTSKILTVSYGTFSCTLEGFDDSFDTMKAIAEYFRDLAADDRYFGAEPPTPDAEMLARIAEREISRRVEAREDGGRIVLRAGTPAKLPRDTDLQTAEEAPDRSAASPARDATEPVRDTAPAPATSADDRNATYESDDSDDWHPRQNWSEAEVMPTVSTDPESVAAKLRRIRAVASPAFASYDHDETAFGGTDTGYAEDEHAQDFLGATIADLDAALIEDDADEQPAEAPVAEEPAAQTPHAADAVATPDGDAAGIDSPTEPEPAVAAPEAAEDDAQMVADIAAHLDQVEDQAPADAIASDDQGAAETAEAEEAQREAAEADLGETIDDDDGDDDDYDDILANLQTEEVDIFDFSDDTAEDEDGDEDDFDEGDDFGDDTDRDEDTLAQLMADALRADDAPAAEAADAKVDEDAAPQLRARVVKMKRRDFEAAIAGGTLEEAKDDQTLSPEEEAELQRELAEVEAEIAGALPAAEADHQEDAAAQDDMEDEDTADDETDAGFGDLIGLDDLVEDAAETSDDSTKDEEDGLQDLRPAARRTARMDAGVADSQAERIFEETDSQLEEPETHQRRNAIQHLRAAVAATRAEKTAGGSMRHDVDDQPYRMDLESAVRPRRPQPVNEYRSERPSTSAARPAPLKLVAEQRIDAPTGPVQPRRVSRADLYAAEPQPEQAIDGADSFSVFAQKMGAHDLPDLLEAAAAYMSDVEGRPQFSRPMLMQKLREIDETGFSREEGLRSFGQLLRQGKLQKLKGGRFTVTDETEFRQAG